MLTRKYRITIALFISAFFLMGVGPCHQQVRSTWFGNWNGPGEQGVLGENGEDPRLHTDAVVQFVQSENFAKSSWDFKLYRMLGDAPVNHVHVGIHKIDPLHVNLTAPTLGLEKVRLRRDKSLKPDFQTGKKSYLTCAKDDPGHLTTCSWRGQKIPCHITFCYAQEGLELTIQDDNQRLLHHLIVLKDSATKMLPMGGSISMNEALGYARFRNELVQEEGSRVNQARSQVQKMRTDLFPKMNTTTAIDLVLLPILAPSPVSPDIAMSIIANCFPFIFRSKWKDLKQAQELAKAEEARLVVLQADEMLRTQKLYHQLFQDAWVLSKLRERFVNIKNIFAELQSLALEGAVDISTQKEMKTQIDDEKRFLEDWKVLVEHEKKQLAYALALEGIDTELGVDLPSITLEDEIDPRGLAPLEEVALREEVLKNSVELKVLDHEIAAAKAHLGSVSWGWCSPETGVSCDPGIISSKNQAAAFLEGTLKAKRTAESTIRENSDDLTLYFNRKLGVAKGAQGKVEDALEIVRTTEKMNVGMSYRIQVTRDQRLVLDREIAFADAIRAVSDLEADRQRITFTGRYANLVESEPPKRQSAKDKVFGWGTRFWSRVQKDAANAEDYLIGGVDAGQEVTELQRLEKAQQTQEELD